MNKQHVARLNLALKVAILESGKTQRVIAVRTGIDETRLSRIVRGQISPVKLERKALTRVLHKAESELFPAEPEPESKAEAEVVAS